MINRIPLTPPVIAGIVIADIVDNARQDPEAFKMAFESLGDEFFSILESELEENDLFDFFIAEDNEDEAFLEALKSETTWHLIRTYCTALYQTLS
jgi:hypothetical protein